MKGKGQFAVAARLGGKGRRYLASQSMQTLELIRKRVEAEPGQIYPPATSKQLDDSEHRLGFSLPPFLRSVYSAIGNGGFGPGYGILGSDGGFYDDNLNTIVDLYLEFRQTPALENNKWSWPQGLLLFCHWGCGIYSCVDCFSPESPVCVWDPNGYDWRTSPTTALRQHRDTIESWFAAWASGIDLWSELFPGDV